ncbi:N-acetyltransferase family protein [Hyphococcus sp.]|uniref:GNAT family N-acetyltransferase n=1 Tax=Hyphococcus sp. TaxID=2038636 RepID=UPI003D0F7320
MPDAPTIREIRSADFDQCAPLWNGYNAFYGRSGATALPDAVTEATWQRFFDPAEPVNCLVADADGELIGFAHYIFHRSTSMMNHNCYLQDLFTAEAARGKGVARALIEAVYERAKSAGSNRVYWLTHETNSMARMLYDNVATRSGFIQYQKNF